MMTTWRMPSFDGPGIWRRLSRRCRYGSAKLLWRLANLVLLTGCGMLKLCLIGPVGMARAWRIADRLETFAEMLWRFRQ